MDDTTAIKVGEVRLSDSGFSISCNEKDALAILKDEACALKANLVVITNEKRPDLWSSCYRCKAEFYRLKTIPLSAEMVSDDGYNQEKVAKRVNKDQTQNSLIYLGILFGMAFVGFLGSL